MNRYSHISCPFRCHFTTSKSHSRFAQHTRTSSFVKVKLLLIILWSPWEVRSHYFQTDSTPWMAYTTWPRTGPNESKDSDCRPVRNMYSKAKDISLAEPSSSSTSSYPWYIDITPLADQAVICTHGVRTYHLQILRQFQCIQTVRNGLQCHVSVSMLPEDAGPVGVTRWPHRSR